ncbi:MAG: ATPase [Clostridium sp.]
MENEINFNVIELLEYLQDTIERAPRVPISGKAMIDKKDVLEIIDQIVNYLPDEFKKAKWIVNEKDRILGEAKDEYNSVRRETIEIMRQNVERHDIVKEAKIRAQEIISSAKKDAKAIRLGSRDYSNEILTDLDKQLEEKREELIRTIEECYRKAAMDIDSNINGISSTIKENIKELQDMK